MPTTPTERIRALAQAVVDAAERGANPGIDIPVRSLSNVAFNEDSQIIEMGDRTQQRTFFNLNMAKRFMQTMLVSGECKKLLSQSKTTSIRDLYYMVKHTIPGTSEETFVDQGSESDPVIEDLEVTLDALREELHLFASNRGSLVGELTVIDSGDRINTRRLGSGGWSIPSIVEPDVIQFDKCTAKFILLIEKDAVWRRFNEDKYWRKHKCILVTGQGQPPRGVRRLVHRMAHELNLPLYVLVDNDPWGYYIYSVIKQGSINLAYESRRMAIPSARFVGLSAFDREKYKIPANVTIKLTKEDINRAKQILNYPWFQKKPWQKEIRQMLRSGVKMELEALSSKDISFITKKYLPRKMKDGDVLD
jgi:DNA topoisomerase VI subunit A